MSVQITQIPLRAQVKEKITEGKKEKLVFLFVFFIFCFLFSVSAQESRYAFKPSDKDPFSPLVSKNGILLIPREVDLGGLVIKGIICSEESPIAIINDKVVGKGENIGDYLVLEIEEKRVILKNGDQEFILKLGEEEE